jgi:hypothetical protein
MRTPLASQTGHCRNGFFTSMGNRTRRAQWGDAAQQIGSANRKTAQCGYDESVAGQSMRAVAAHLKGPQSARHL